MAGLGALELEAIVAQLAAAERTHTPTAGLPPRCSIADAYRVQHALAASRTGHGTRQIGWKVGATSSASQRFLGADEPMFGPLFDDMRVADGGACRHADLIAPRLEIELAFETGRHGEMPVRVAPAFEIVDSRTEPSASGVVHTIADLGRACRFVLGDWLAISDLPPAAALHGSLWRDGEQVAAGPATTVLGDPRQSVQWLAGAVRRRGLALRAGDVVLSGSFIAPVPARPGERYEARFGTPVGSVHIQFT